MKMNTFLKDIVCRNTSSTKSHQSNKNLGRTYVSKALEDVGLEGRVHQQDEVETKSEACQSLEQVQRHIKDG